MSADMLMHAVAEPGDPGYVPAVGERFAPCHTHGPYVSERNWYVCTLPTGHVGYHESRTHDGDLSALWKPGTTFHAPAKQPPVGAVVAVPGERIMDGPLDDAEVASIRAGVCVNREDHAALLAASDAALRYRAGQVHPGETTAGRRMREGLVRDLMAALRKVRGEGAAR